MHAGRTKQRAGAACAYRWGHDRGKRQASGWIASRRDIGAFRSLGRDDAKRRKRNDLEAMLVEGVQHLVRRPAQRWMMQRPQGRLIGNKARIVGDHGGLAS